MKAADKSLCRLVVMSSAFVFVFCMCREVEEVYSEGDALFVLLGLNVERP